MTVTQMSPEDVDRLVLTYFHDDRGGGAAEVASRRAAEVIAHLHDPPILRGEQAGPSLRYCSDFECELSRHSSAGPLGTGCREERLSGSAEPRRKPSMAPPVATRESAAVPAVRRSASHPSS